MKERVIERGETERGSKKERVKLRKGERAERR